jgi:WD40 repeat protein
MKSILQVALIFSFLAGSSNTWAQRECSALFLDTSTEKIIQDLASLTVDRDNHVSNGNRLMAKIIHGELQKKFAQAREAKIDLSSFPKILETLRNGKIEEAQVEENRRIEAKNSEMNLVALRWRVTDTLSFPRGIKDSQVSPDGQILAISSGNSLKTYDLEKKTYIHDFTNPDYNFQSLEFSSDGARLLAVNVNKLVVFDLAKKSIIYTIEVSKHGMSLAHFSPDGKNLLFGSKSTTLSADRGELGSLKLIDIASGKTLFEEKTVNLTSAQFSPDGKRALFTSMLDREAAVSILNIKTKKVIQEITFGDSFLLEARFSADGKNLVALAEKVEDRGEKTLSVWETSRWNEIHADAAYWDFDISPRSDKIVYSPDKESLTVFDLKNKKEAYSIPAEKEMAGNWGGFLRFDISSSQVLLGHGDKDKGAIYTWDLGSKNLAPVGKIKGPLHIVQTSPTGNVLVVNDGDNKIKIFERYQE